MKSLFNALKNPVQLQVLLYLQKYHTLIAKDFLAENSDISQATFYRTLKKMEKNQLITVYCESKKRGLVEKTYVLTEAFKNTTESIILENNGELYEQLLINFFLEILNDFHEYTKRESIDIANDGSGFSAMPIYATTEELVAYSKQISAILAPALIRQRPDQQKHIYAAIVTPPSEKE